jgi:hypothetical protein
VITLLIDHNIERQATLLWGALAAEGWLELVSLRLVRFTEMGLPLNSSDRVVWRFAQAQGLLLLTDNRNMKGEDSLEQTLREENTLSSLPILTIGNTDRLDERDYREQCTSRLIEIILDLESYLGTGRLFIP